MCSLRLYSINKFLKAGKILPIVLGTRARSACVLLLFFIFYYLDGQTSLTSKIRSAVSQCCIPLFFARMQWSRLLTLRG